MPAPAPDRPQEKLPPFPIPTTGSDQVMFTDIEDRCAEAATAARIGRAFSRLSTPHDREAAAHCIHRHAATWNAPSASRGSSSRRV